MKRPSKCEALKDCLRRYAKVFGVYAWQLLLGAVLFDLYELPKEPLWYWQILSLSAIMLMFLSSFIRNKRQINELKYLLSDAENGLERLPKTLTAAEEEYRLAIERLVAKISEQAEAHASERRDMLDYYTVWVHQIKTPIAVLRMRIAQENAENRSLLPELFRIEQYADMAMQYIRLSSSVNDLVVQEYPLDGLIRDVIRKYAPLFIGKKLYLRYDGTDVLLVTDKTWFECILEQLLSNAVKYTHEGGVTVTVDKNSVSVSDTGVGIAAEDIPQIFENGYTGLNGRIGQSSSGLGLFLAGKAAKLLALNIDVTSERGIGTAFTVTFPKDRSR